VERSCLFSSVTVLKHGPPSISPLSVTHRWIKTDSNRWSLAKGRRRLRLSDRLLAPSPEREISDARGAHGSRSGSVPGVPADPAAASVVQLADVASPLVQCREDVVGSFRHQADIDPRSAEVAEPFQLVEIVWCAADGNRQRGRIAPQRPAPSYGMLAGIPRDCRSRRSDTNRRRSGSRVAPPMERRRRE